MSNILLTGSTGVLGGRLLQELLQHTDAVVYCLVRGTDADLARQRIEDVLYCYDEARTLAGQAWRVVPVSGDVSQPWLGLDEGVWRELLASIDLVLHCAANVSLVASYNKIAPVNVQGVQHVIDFCLAGAAPMLFASSFSMVGDKLYEDGFVLKESDLDVGQGFENMDYERSKFTAEKLIRDAGRRGLDWVVVRPGNIWGDSVTGCYPLTQTKVKGIYYEMLRSLVEAGMTFPSDEDFDITPVDYVARACLHLATHLESSRHCTYNLTNPRPITYDGIVAALRRHGYTVRDVEMHRYFEALQQGRLLRAGKPYRSVFTDLLSVFYDGGDEKERARYDTTQAEAALLPAGIACAASDQALISRYLDYAARVGFLAAPRAQGPLSEICDAALPQGFMERLYDGDLSETAPSP